MRKEEAIIKEKRTLEATQKNLMGSEGKLGVILRRLGSPIIAHHQGGSLFDASYLESWEDLPEEDVIPTMAVDSNDAPEGWEWDMNPQDPEDVTLTQIGWMFDGLSRSMHFEIKYDDQEKILTAHYKGHLVYKEIAGDLATYVPLQEWEDYVERLFIAARPKEYQAQLEEREERKIEIKRAKQSFLQKMRDKWGL